MMEHASLASEIPFVERLPLCDRLRQAKKRRAQQLKAYTQREKRLMKEASLTEKRLVKRGSDTSAATTASEETVDKTGQRKRLQFAEGVLMMEAVARSDISEVTRLLTAGVSANVSGSDGLTPLHQCCINNAELLFQLLLDAGANVDACDCESWTPLHAAAACGRVSFCKQLCESGANVLAINSEGNMPYDLCEDIPSLDVIETEMTKRGVTQQLIDDTRLVPENAMMNDIQTLVIEGGHVSWHGSFGETLLHIAACSGYTRVMKFLIDSGSDFDARDNDTWLPIHCAAYWAQVSAVELLLHHGVSSTVKTQDGLTIFDLCEEPESKRKISEIVDELANKDTHNQPATTSLTSSHRHGRRASLTGGAALQAWQRRTSITEKKDPLAWREAKEEAYRLQEAISAALADENEGATDSVANGEDLPRSSVAFDGSLPGNSNNSSAPGGTCDLGAPASDDVMADEVATPASDSVSPTLVTVAILADSQKSDEAGTPSSPGGPRSSLFSKRSGITPATPPVKESHVKKSPPLAHEGRRHKSSKSTPKSKSCCAIV